MGWLLTLLLTTYFAPAASPPETVEWLGETTYATGDISYGQDYEHAFTFRNLTSDSLLIDNVRVGCGCTASDWEETPVAPGEVGRIRVTYDALSRGYFRKYVKVFFVGHRGGHKLWLEGYVE